MNSIQFDRRFCVAPMMDLTDKHFRYMFRLISPHSLLYSEMVTASAVIHGDRERLLSFNQQEHPLALQLGGSDVTQLVESCKIGEQFGYDEINLNCGCPSDRVQSGHMGACLMAEPDVVAQCLHAMQDAVSVPVSVKCRIGINRNDSVEELENFVHTLSSAGCRVFIIHARKAWLDGLSPKENREIPPLRYDSVYAVKQRFPHLEIVINGGIKTTGEVADHLKMVDGVMLGREAYYNPFAMCDIARLVYGESGCPLYERESLVELYLEYMLKQNRAGVPVSKLVRHLIPIYQSVSGAKAWRRCLSEGARGETNLKRLVENALSFIHHPQPTRKAAS